MDFLAKAIDERDAWLVWLKVDPRFDPLRATSSFRGMLTTIGLEP